MISLKNKVVLITGAANGIGAALVRLLVEQEIKHVRILDVDEEAGVALEKELKEKYGDSKIQFTKCDITKDDELFQAFDEVIKGNGYIDCVINNAGLTDESSSEYIRREVDVNVTALINGTLKAIELMRIDKGGKGGTVVNVSSVASLIRMSPLLFVYAATKSAVLQFSNCIGKEPYHSTTGVKVVTICYGTTKTAILEKAKSFDEENISIKELVALYPVQTPEEAALGTLEAILKGESGSTWLIHNGKPAKDITPNIEKAYNEIAQLLEDH